MVKGNRVNLTEGMEAELLAEVNHFCPLCHKPLIEQKGNRKYKKYQIAHIYPHSATPEQRIILAGVPKESDIESRGNLIPLCKDCHGRQDFHTTRDDYLRLRATKLECAGRYQAKIAAYDSPLEPGIKALMEALSKFSGKEKISLSLDPLMVKQKVGDGLLCRKILHSVTQYFSFVQNEFKRLEIEKHCKFELIASQIRQYFLRTEKFELFQDQIFNQIVEWIMEKTQSSREASEIVVSFFVQNCEVFRALTK